MEAGAHDTEPRTEPYPNGRVPVKRPARVSDPRRRAVPAETLSRTKVDLARGLLEPKHRKQLGEAWHLYLNLLDRKPPKSAWVYGRRRVTISTLAIMEHVDERTARAWLHRLEAQGYVTVQRFPGYAPKAGIRIHISKPKDWVGGEMKLLREQTPAPRTPSE
jgi:hypothetical protein